VSCVLYVASFSGLFILITPSVFSNVYLSCVLCTIGRQFLWIVHFWLPLWCSLTFIIFNLQFQFSAFHEHHISNIIFKTANVIVCGNYLHKLTIYLFSAIQYCQNPISRLISWYLVFSNIFIYVPVESRVLAKNRLLTINEL
jgi:hypothetical protein